MKEKFKIKQEEYTLRNIRFPNELIEKIKENKGNYSFNKFVVEACLYALDNMDKDN